jgi:hypothetical protein
MEDANDYYKRYRPMTTAGPFHSELQVFLKSVADLCRVIQGNLIHRELAAWLYDLKLSPEQTNAANTRPLTQRIQCVAYRLHKPLPRQAL